MSNPLFNLSPYQSEAPQTKRADWTDATGTDPAWDEPDGETNRIRPDDDAPTGWQSAAEFTLTLLSGQTVEVKFVPGLVGKRRMHEFSFTGPVSSTGFKSHFVLAVESESEWATPADYAQAYAKEMVARFEAQQRHSGKKLKHTDQRARATPEVSSADDDSLIEPAMPADKTDALNHNRVEVVEELSPSEEADRQRLELKVERAFYEAGL